MHPAAQLAMLADATVDLDDLLRFAKDISQYERPSAPPTPAASLRADEPAPSLPLNQVLQNTQAAPGGFIAVPRTVDG